MALTVLTQTDKSLHNKRIAIFCDNQAVIAMVNNLLSSCKQCQKLIRIIALLGIHYNLCVFVKFVESKDNGRSDALSRLQYKRFWELAPPTTEKFPSQLDFRLWPVTQIWNDDLLYISLF